MNDDFVLNIYLMFQTNKFGFKKIFYCTLPKPESMQFISFSNEGERRHQYIWKLYETSLFRI